MTHNDIKCKAFKMARLTFACLIIISSLVIPGCLSTKQTDDEIIWQDNFESGDLTGWKIIDEVNDVEESHWYVEKGFLIQDTDFGSIRNLLGTTIINGNSDWDNYTVRANINCTDDDFIGILFRYVDENNYYRFLLSSQRKTILVDKRVNGKFTTIARYGEEEWQYARFSATIAVYAEDIKVYLNDSLFFDIEDSQFDKGKIGLTSISNLGSFFDDITVYSEYQIQPVEKKLSIIRGPYLQNVLDDHAVIMWNTSIPANSIVEFGLNKDSSQTLSSDQETTKHEVMLNGLKAGYTYYYRVKSNTIVSDWFSFESYPGNNTAFSFIAYGDTQMGFLRHNELAKQIGKHEFDFIINCGDVVQRGPRADWDLEFFEPMKEILTGKPVYAAIGNHELNSENYYKNFSNPAPDHESYYSFQYGNSFFIVIDNAKAYAPERKYYTEYEKGSEQYKWLQSELASDKAQSAEWLFVVSHVPSYVGGGMDLFPGCRESLVPLFEKYDVDISFSGHVHGYGRGEVNEVTYIITAGGGGAQNKKGSEEKLEYKGFQLVYNFCDININGSQLHFKAFDINNKLIDEFTIEK